MITWLKHAGAFAYDFVIGDDWRGAVVVALALAVTALLTRAVHLDAWWLLPVAIVAVLGWSLRRAVRAR